MEQNSLKLTKSTVHEMGSISNLKILSITQVQIMLLIVTIFVTKFRETNEAI